MTESKQSLFWLRERAWFQISAFIVLFLCVRWSLLGLVETLATYAGLNRQWTIETIQKNEIPLQILSFCASEWLLGLISLKRGFLRDFALMTQIRDVRRSQMVLAFSESFFKGFALASLAVALSVFSGLSILETPVSWSSTFLSQAGNLLWNSLEITLWFFCLELFRFPLWRRIRASSGTQIHGHLLLILFQGWLYYRVASAHSFTSDWQLILFAASLWLSTMSLLWAQSSWTQEPARSFWPSLFSRSAFSAGFLISLLHVYGFPIAGRHEASLISTARGPLVERFAHLHYESFLGHAAVLLVLVLVSERLLRRTSLQFLRRF